MLSAEFTHGVSINDNFSSVALADCSLFGFMEACHANVVPKPADNKRGKMRSQANIVMCWTSNTAGFWILGKSSSMLSLQGYPDVITGITFQSRLGLLRERDSGQ